MTDLGITRIVGVVLVVIAVAALPSMAQQAGDEQGEPRLYDLNVAGVDGDDAERQLVKKCYESYWKCTTKWTGNEWLTVWAPREAHEWFLAKVEEWDTPAPTVAFRLSLLIARPGEGAVPKLSSDGQAALDDLQQFLPGSSFELLGSGIITLQPGEHGRTILAGEEGYRATMKFATNGAPGKIRIYFSLSDAVSSTDEAGRPTLRYRDVLENAFGMSIGETVVVGTSQAVSDASESLIVLLAAGD